MEGRRNEGKGKAGRVNGKRRVLGFENLGTPRSLLARAREEAEALSDEEEDEGRFTGSASAPTSSGRHFGRSPPHRGVVLQARNDEEAELALALSLSLASLAPRAPAGRRGLPPRSPRAPADAALSYEALSELEDVRTTLSPAVVNALPLVLFNDAAHGDVRCPICLVEASEGDVLMVLPSCGHAMHAPCGRELLTLWSKRCPDCKAEVVP